MKRFWITTLIVFSVILCAGFWAMGVHAADSNYQYVCGKTYTFFQSEVVYMLKFNSANVDLPCTSGTAMLSWLDNKTTYEFSIDSREMIIIKNVGRAFAVGYELFWLDSCTIIFDEF
jgi:hypothetical protein